MSDDAGSTSNPSSAARPYAPFLHIKSPPPLTLSGCTPKEWKLWKQLWLNYAIVANLATRKEQYQKALFLCTIGKEALEVYNAFEYEADQEPGKIKTIISKFDEYFTGDINETYEHFKFNQRAQGMNESFDSYLTELRNMLKTCNFCTCLTDSLLRDRIVLGTKDDHTRKRLLQERSLNLKTYAKAEKWPWHTLGQWVLRLKKYTE